MASKDQMMKDHLYGDLLVTPGYDVEFVVGTTYSLDMEALLIVPYSLGMFGELSSQTQGNNQPLNNKLFLLESIRRSSDNFVLFCHRGGIHSPRQTMDYYPLLENSIVEVQDSQLPKSNFHPKMWIVKEVNREDKQDKQLKVIIMSKNLTYDNNIDVVVALTGKLKSQEVSPNKEQHLPLAEFVRRLAEKCDVTDKRTRAAAMADDLLHVTRFEVDDTRFEKDAYEFVPFLFGENLNPRVAYPSSFQGKSMMIISPFLDCKTIEEMNERSHNGERILVTRADYVSRDVFDLYNRGNGAIYVVKEQMLDNEFASIDLHAKTYLVENPKNEGGVFLYMGSANATCSGFRSNSELLVRLKFKRGQMVFDRFANDFLGMENGESERYEKVAAPTESQEKHEYSELEKSMRQMLTCKFSAEVSSANNGLYDVAVSANIKERNFKLEMAPLQMPSIWMPISNRITFPGLPLMKLSEFYIVKGTDGDEEIKKVIKIPTKDMPKERDDEIFRCIVNTKEKFYKYISFMLCEDLEEYVFELETAEKIMGPSDEKTEPTVPTRIYEQMLRIAARSPQQFEGLDDVVRIEKDADFAQDFLALYNEFKPLIPKLKKLL